MTIDEAIAHCDSSLKAENERLRNTLVQYGLFEAIVGDPAEEFAKLRRDLHRAKRENAKLRELVRDMYGYVFNREIELCNECACADDGDCGACDEYDGACGIAKRRFEELYSDCIRELGIEVE